MYIYLSYPFFKAQKLFTKLRIQSRVPKLSNYKEFLALKKLEISPSSLTRKILDVHHNTVSQFGVETALEHVFPVCRHDRARSSKSEV